MSCRTTRRSSRAVADSVPAHARSNVWNAGPYCSPTLANIEYSGSMGVARANADLASPSPTNRQTPLSSTPCSPLQCAPPRQLLRPRSMSTPQGCACCRNQQATHSGGHVYIDHAELCFGVACFCSRVEMRMASPASPAAGSRWPMLALTPVSVSDTGYTSARERVSVGSPRDVPVQWDSNDASWSGMLCAAATNWSNLA